MNISYTANLSVIEQSIISLTSALYNPVCFDIIRKDELRDALSGGQLISKKWLLDNLYLIPIQIDRLAVVGGWLGLMAKALSLQLPSTLVDSIDLSPESTKIAQLLMSGRGSAISADMYYFDYTPYDCVVNTAAEHIPDIRSWVDLVSDGTYLIVQSNNARDIPDHVNCVDSADELKDQLNLSEVYFCDELVFPMYTRYMVIGKK